MTCWPMLAGHEPFVGAALMGLGSALWAVLLTALVWGLVHWLQSVHTATVASGWRDAGVRPTPAREMLRERYARGEIDAATFEEMVTLLLATDTRGDQPGL